MIFGGRFLLPETLVYDFRIATVDATRTIQLESVLTEISAIEHCYSRIVSIEC
jgi:hypothetical protein